MMISCAPLRLSAVCGHGGVSVAVSQLFTGKMPVFSSPVLLMMFGVAEFSAQDSLVEAFQLICFHQPEQSIALGKGTLKSFLNSVVTAIQSLLPCVKPEFYKNLLPVHPAQH